MTDTKPTTAESLRLLADWYEKNPDMPAPANIVAYAFDAKAEEARTIARALGTFEKGGDGSFLRLKRAFGALALEVTLYRDTVCTKRIVKKEVEVEEWDCWPLLDDRALKEIGQ